MAGKKKIFKPAVRKPIVKRNLSLQERLAVIEASKKCKNIRQLSLMFACGRTQISNIILHQDDYIGFDGDRERKPHLEKMDGCSKRIHLAGFGTIERALAEWVARCRSYPVSIIDTNMRAVANRMARFLDLKYCNIYQRWLVRFRAKYGFDEKDLENSRRPSVIIDENARPSLDIEDIMKAVNADIVQQYGVNPSTVENFSKGKSIKITPGSVSTKNRANTTAATYQPLADNDEGIDASEKICGVEDDDHERKRNSATNLEVKTDFNISDDAVLMEEIEIKPSKFQVWDNVLHNPKNTEKSTEHKKIPTADSIDPKDLKIDSYEQALKTLESLKDFAVFNNENSAVLKIKQLSCIFTQKNR